MDGGASTDPEGPVNGYEWIQVSGPNLAQIQTQLSRTTSVDGLVAGTYIFQLVVIDENFASSSPDTVTVTVAAGGSFSSWTAGVAWNGQDSTAGGDADNDGFNNLIEYALGLDPLNQDPANGLALSLNGTDLRLGFTRLLPHRHHLHRGGHR